MINLLAVRKEKEMQIDFLSFEINSLCTAHNPPQLYRQIKLKIFAVDSIRIYKSLFEIDITDGKIQWFEIFGWVINEGAGWFKEIEW